VYDVDLYCLECGYNLRGLSGDPRRCPECGHLNPMGDLELPAALITAQLRQMETNPAVSVAAVLFGSVFLALFVFALIQNAGQKHPGSDICLATPVLASILVWSSRVVSFRKSCRARPGWAEVLWVYHVYGLSLSLAVGGLLLSPLITHSLISSRAGALRTLIPVLEGLIALPAAFLTIIFLGQRAHRRLKEAMEPLQRDVAVTIARGLLRRRLVHHRSW